MTKKRLSWRLQDLPTAGEVAELVDSEVITKDEAREILFNDKSTSERDPLEIKALKEQVEFLQGLVTKLSENRTFPTFIGYKYVSTTPAVYWTNTLGNVGKVMGGGGVMATTSSGTKGTTYSL